MNIVASWRIARVSFVLLTGMIGTRAATITVNNNTGAVADHNNIADAIAAASAGDTLLVAGSSTNYGVASLDKQLKIVGPGYFLAENNVPGVTPGIDDQPAAMTLTLLNSSVEGSRFVGLSITNVNYGPVTSDMLWDRCRFLANVTWSGATNFRVTRCYFEGWLSIGASTNTTAIGCNMNRLYLDGGAVASHCTIRGSGNAAFFNITGGSAATNCLVIRWNNNGQVPIITGSVTHCVGINTELPPSESDPAATPDASNNYDNVPFADLATVILAPAPPYANDAYYQLNTANASNPALANASDGTDIGAFGGPVPYRLAGQPSIPKISNLVVPGLASPTSGLNVKVTVTEPTP